MSTPRKPYPSDVTDDEWAFVAPYLTRMDEAAPQRCHDLREVFNALRWLVRTGSPWRYLPHEFPPWAAVYQQTQRWLAAGCFVAMADDLRALLREAAGRDPHPTAVILDGRTLQATPESGQRAGFDGHKKRKGSKLHAAVDTLGTASSWWWSACPRPSGASSCCRAAGWSSAPSLGSRGSAAWRKITNGCRKRSSACISSPSPASCFIVRSRCSAQVHNTL